MSSTPRREATINLAPGPSSLPTQVLLEAAQGLLDYEGTGIGIAELSHRSSTFGGLLKRAEADLRALLDIPDNYRVLFTQGGGLGQFAAVALNLIAAHRAKYPDYGKDNLPPADYIVTGGWSDKAAKEAARLGGVRVNVAAHVKKDKGAFGSIPSPESWKLNAAEDKPAYLYYCDNETVDGVEFPSSTSSQWPFSHLPEEYRNQVPLVADMSSNILSRRVNVSAHALIYFGAQKNVGPSGLTVVIVRDDLVVDPDLAVEAGGPRIPIVMSYKALADNASLFNTPPMFSIYVSALVFRRLIETGGVPGAERRNVNKARAVYTEIDESGGFYHSTVDAGCRSQMNITFRIGQDGDGLEERFIKEAGERGIKQIKGHRSVGGIRTSIYNAITEEQVNVLVAFMKEFRSKEQQAH